MRRLITPCLLGVLLLLLASGCSSTGSLDPSGSYTASLLVTGLTAGIEHSLTITRQGSGYIVTIAPTDATAPGALSFNPGASARVAAAGGAHVFVHIGVGSGSVGSYNALAGSPPAAHEITTGTMDFSFTESTLGDPVLESAIITLHSANGPVYSATLAP